MTKKEPLRQHSASGGHPAHRFSCVNTTNESFQVSQPNNLRTFAVLSSISKRLAQRWKQLTTLLQCQFE
jgi:hypothetical protein